MKKHIKKIITRISIGLIAFTPIILCLTSCKPIAEKEIIGNLFPNLWVFLSHIFATVVLLSICLWLVWKPLKSALAKRSNYIQEEIKQAEEARKEAIENLQASEKEKLEAYTRAKTIVENATNQAYSEKEKIESQAKTNVKKITEDAKYEAEKIQTQIRSEMKEQIIDIAFSATEALLKEKVSEKDNQKFIDDFIHEISKEKGIK